MSTAQNDDRQNINHTHDASPAVIGVIVGLTLVIVVAAVVSQMFKYRAYERLARTDPEAAAVALTADAAISALNRRR